MKKMSIVLTLLLMVIAVTATTSGFSNVEQQGSKGQTLTVLTANSGGPIPVEIVLNSSNRCSAQDMMISAANKAAGSEWTDRNLTVIATDNQSLQIAAITDSTIIFAKVQPFADSAVNDSRGSFHAGKIIASSSTVVNIANENADNSGGNFHVGKIFASTHVAAGMASIIT